MDELTKLNEETDLLNYEILKGLIRMYPQAKVVKLHNACEEVMEDW